MRVLGIDPGTATMGWGIIDRQGSTTRLVDYGVLTSPPELADHLRLKMLYDGLMSLFTTFQPEAASVEKLYFGQNSRTAMVVGQARGIVLLALALHNVPYIEMSPAEVKQAVTGYGRADKRQVQLMVQRLLGLREYPRPDDAADALAVAICGAETIKFARSSGAIDTGVSP